MSEAAYDYYRRLATVVWNAMTERERKRLCRNHQMVYLSLKGMAENERR